MDRGWTAQRLLALFFAGWLLLDFPLLRLWTGGGTWFGLPLLPAALFALWLLIIVALALLMERPDRGEASADAAEAPRPPRKAG